MQSGAFWLFKPAELPPVTERHDVLHGQYARKSPIHLDWRYRSRTSCAFTFPSLLPDEDSACS